MNEVEITKIIERVRDDANKDMERYLGVLSESHEKTLQTINENFVLVNMKLDSHTEMIGEMKEDISILKDDVSVLKTDVAVLRDDMKEVKGELKEKVGQKEFSIFTNKAVV